VKNLDDGGRIVKKVILPTESKEKIVNFDDGHSTGH
jgi:hypothetical protein